MCGLCRLFRGKCGGCRISATEETAYACRREEPRMHVHCESGLGRADNALCGCEHTHNACGRCARSHSCDCD